MNRMISIFNPSISPWIIIRSWWGRGAETFCEDWFRQYTGKKYVLITSSCRSAMWLAYKASDASGEVITTPLICHSAMVPALSASLNIRFCDLAPGSFLMDTTQVERQITTKTRYIQATHHGGQMLDIPSLMETARKHNLLVIEDCAQAFSASRNGISAGTSGDIACFTLSKNCYSVGGGILATDDEEIFRKASAMQREWPRFPWKLLWYRVARYLLETYRDQSLAAYLYDWMMERRKRNGRKNSSVPKNSIRLYRPATLFSRLFRVQQPRFEFLSEKTAFCARALLEALKAQGVQSFTPMEQASFPKFFFTHPRLNAQKAIPKLIKAGIEARHLENKYGSPFQKRFEDLGLEDRLHGLDACVHYKWLYNRIISLPMHHALTYAQINHIAQTVKAILHEEDTD